jgi:hypothetical protein
MQEAHRQALKAADELYRVASEDVPLAQQLPVLPAVLEPYRSARERFDLLHLPKKVALALEAADELADWLQDFIEVQAESETEQGKSFMGVWGALVYYEEARSGVPT